MTDKDLERNTTSATTANQDPLILTWSGLTVTAPKRPRPLLGPLDGQARAGELLAGEGAQRPAYK